MIFTVPLNTLFFSEGVTTDTCTVMVPSSGERFEPLQGVNVQFPQEGHSMILQSRSEVGSPMFSTVNVPLTVMPGFIFDQLRLPSQFKSGYTVDHPSVVNPLMQKFAV